MFNIFGNKHVDNHDHPLTVVNGSLILFLLAVEGYRPDLAAQIKEEHHPPPSLLYYEVAKYSFILIFAIALVTTHLWKIVVFIWEHDSLSLDLMTNSILTVLGEIFIYRILVAHKQHIIPFITTIRKLCTSVFNLIWFRHTVENLQVVALGIVAFGILL